MPSDHRLRRGLLGYLIPFAPHAFVPQCQDRSSRMPSHLVFLPILTHFTVTPAIPSASSGLEPSSFTGSPPIESKDFIVNLLCHVRTLYAQRIRITLGASVLPLLLAQS